PFQAEVNRLLSLTDAYRASNGLSQLTLDSRLTAAAQYQANYMARTGDYSHVDLDGRTLPHRVHAPSYSCSWVGENIHPYHPATPDLARPDSESVSQPGRRVPCFRHPAAGLGATVQDVRLFPSRHCGWICFSSWAAWVSLVPVHSVLKSS